LRREDVVELHYITPIANVASILRLGILSHVRARKVAHDSVALEEIQMRRSDKRVPGARALHEYVNLYFDAHNPMLSRVRDRNGEIAVLRVSPEMLDLPGTLVCTGNAASNYARFCTVDVGLAHLDRERVFAQYWTHRDDPFDEFRHKVEKCAEVLVPDSVTPDFIVGAYVAHRDALACWSRAVMTLAAEVRHGFFF
jgi:hypothetical protein